MKLIASSITINDNTIKDNMWQINTLADVINRVMPFLFSAAGVILVIVLMWGGIDVMLSQGNAQKVKDGRAKITSGIIGFVLLLLSFFMTRLLAYIFGLNSSIL